jgi:hypothetical protein
MDVLPLGLPECAFAPRIVQHPRNINSNAKHKKKIINKRGSTRRWSAAAVSSHATALHASFRMLFGRDGLCFAASQPPAVRQQRLQQGVPAGGVGQGGLQRSGRGG